MNAHRLVLAILLVVCPFTTNAMAQSAAPALEAGVHAGFLRLSDFDTTNAGIGGRVTLHLTRWMAVEGEGTFFPSDDVFIPSSSSTPSLQVVYERKRVDAFFGTKLGRRADRFGVFAKIRPGFTRLSGGAGQCVGPDCALILLVRPEYQTEFAFDLGGVFELYPSARTVARFELGDIIIRHRGVAVPCPRSTCGTSHNLATRVGVGMRF
jgi:hypothetical protein